MTDWIADAEAGSSVRTKLNGLLRPLAAATILPGAPVVAIKLALPTTHFDFRLTFRNFFVTSGQYLLFALGDEGVDGDFYKDDEEFLGYFIGIRGNNATTALYSETEDGYGWFTPSVMLALGTGVQVIDATIDAGSASSPAIVQSEGIASVQGNLATASWRVSSLFYPENGPMNAIRICGQDGSQLHGTYVLEGRVKP